MRFTLFIFTLLAFTACENMAEESKRFSEYFDVDSLLDNQRILLSEWKVRVNKFARLDGKEDTANYLLDSLRFSQEFSAFRKANINKPAYDDRYKESIGHSNDEKIITYTPVKNSDDLEVKHLKIKYRDNYIQEIEALVEENHWLYDSKRTFTMSFSSVNGVMQITHFSIEGSQKMILRDRVTFIVTGELENIGSTSDNIH